MNYDVHPSKANLQCSLLGVSRDILVYDLKIPIDHCAIKLVRLFIIFENIKLSGIVFIVANSS